MALVAPPLRFTAHATNRDGHRVSYTVQFTHGEAHRLSLRIDATEVLDVVAVAFFPVALRSPDSPFADEYVMSVWRRDVGVADPQIVHDFQFYSTSLANAEVRDVFPVRPIFLRPSTLRFEEPQIRAAVNEERWARFDWHSVRFADGGYVLALPSFAMAMYRRSTAPVPAPVVAAPLRFTAHAINRDGDRVPYTVQFTEGAVSGRLRLLNLRIDHIDAGVSYEEEVQDVIAVAFYPVALEDHSAFADEYVMSVWQRDVGVAEPQLVHNFNLYSTSLANARFEALAPVNQIFVTGATLRFEEPQLRAAVNEYRWGRVEWTCARMMPGGFVLATPAPADDPADQVADNLALIELGDDPADHVADDDESSSEGEDDLESLWLAELDGYNFRNDDRGDGSDDGSDDRSSDNLRENSSPWVPDDSSDIDDPDDPAADISALLESGTLTDDEKVDITEKWECGICLLGLEAGSHLVSAHAVAADSGGRHRLHVFHSQCLRNWRGSGSACSHLCPTCKLPLGPRPLPAAWSATTRLSAPMAACLSAACWSMPNPYLTTQSGVACVAIEPRPQRPALRVKKTLAPKRQPPRPPSPPGDGCADDQEWHYSWRLVVPVGSQPGEWPERSAVDLCEESHYSVMENDADTQDRVREEVIRHLESVFVPVSAQDAEWWTRLRNTYEFQGHEEGGALLGDSNLNKRHLLYVYFRNDGRRVTRAAWESGRQSGVVTSVSIRYRGPARFRPRHPGAQQLVEHRLRPNEVSPVFGF